MIMLIDSLETMETIVGNNDTLSWDGWTVIESSSKKNGLLSKDGAYVNGAWIVQKRYEPDAKGWNIPKRLVSSDESE